MLKGLPWLGRLPSLVGWWLPLPIVGWEGGRPLLCLGGLLYLLGWEGPPLSLLVLGFSLPFFGFTVSPDPFLIVVSLSPSGWTVSSLLGWWSPSLLLCVGCDMVQADHAPEAGVAQGIFHGILVRHHGRIQEEVEEGLEEEVERHEEEDNTQEQMHLPMTTDGKKITF